MTLMRFVFLSLVLFAAFTAFAGCKQGGRTHQDQHLRLSMIPANDPGKMLRDRATNCLSGKGNWSKGSDDDSLQG